jgi:outer membrane protein OmpA-like peptidoglycan-associated protein
VHGIDLPHKPGDKITVVMDLNASTREIIKHDSVASIETSGVLGSQYVAISFGSAGQSEVKDGELIQSQQPLLMADLFKKASGILDSSQQVIQNATSATAHLDSVTGKIDSGQGTVGELINDKQIYSNLASSTAGMQTTVQKAQVGVTAFQENMEALKHNFFLKGYFNKRGYEDSSDLTANRIAGLPPGAPIKRFTFTAKQLFDSSDSAKLKNQKSLADAGEFLARNPFGLAVIVASTGMEGDTQKDLVLTEARAMVVREYLVVNYGFDDRELKTLGLGKQAGETPNAEGGSIQILIFPAGTEIPPNKPAQAAISSAANASRPVEVTAASAHKP